MTATLKNTKIRVLLLKKIEYRYIAQVIESGEKIQVYEDELTFDQP